ncbi:MAG: DUF998 domain-containing protein [Rhizobiaceae bacterium]|nr:DUF998 domain-containing protein [Rhizobiaceae bacterium]
MSRFLWTGIVGPFVYLATVLAGGAVTPGYSHVVHAVSELTQRGAPHALPLGAGFAVSAILCGMFGLAVAASGRSVRLPGWLIAGYGVIAFLLATIFPMDPIGSEVTFAGVAHIVLVALSGLMLVGAIIVAALRLRGELPWFLPVSIAAAILMLAGGASSAVMIANEIAMTGLAERVTLSSYLLWFAVLATVLMRLPAPRVAVPS